VYTNGVKRTLFLLVFLGAALGALAATVKIESPATAQTYASWSMSNQRLFWNTKDQTLCAQITFDNHLHSASDSPPARESFTFPLPGVKLDPKTKTFYAESKTKQKVTVAETRKSLFVDTIVPTPTTKIFVLKKSGAVNVVLAADTESRPGSGDRQWVECNDDQRLQGLLRSF